MELVYLWVEDYKNINKQGFSFSSRFKCEFKDEYDTNGKLKDNCELIIHKNEDYVSIFPKNINITAIVGENGSGKSSILEAIVQIQSKDFNEIKGFLLFELNLSLYIIDTKGIVFDQDKIQLIELSTFNRKMAISKKNKFITLWMDALNSYSIKNNKRLQLVLQLNSLFYQFNQNDINEKHYELLQEVNLLNILGEYYFDAFHVTLKSIKVDYKNYWREYSSSENKKLLKVIESIPPRIFNNKDFKFVIVHDFYIACIRFYLKHWQDVMKIANCNFKNLFIDFISSINNKLDITAEELYNLTKDFNSNIRKILDKDSNLIPFLNILLLKHTSLSIILENLIFDYSKNESNFIDSKFYKIHKFGSNKEIKESIDSIKYFIGVEEDWSEFDFFHIDIINQKNGNKYSTLSDGERQLLNISLDLIYALKNAKTYGRNQLIIFDEADSFLHPKLSKSLIYRLKKVIQNYNNLINNEVKLHLLFSTHSPFILSDLPKENVIFLKNGKQDYSVNIDTFGANIHTLLSHGFFMNEGLIGEFAKEKIQYAIDALNENNPNYEKKDKVQNIINIIGEPFLKNKLQDMYDTVFLDEKERLEKIKMLEKDIERLKNVNNRKK